MVEFYQERMRRIGDLTYVTHTRILKPISNRSYFYLVYGTRHPKGLLEFRAVERKAIKEQDLVRGAAKQYNRRSRSGQSELFSGPEIEPASFEREESIRLESAREMLRCLVRERDRISYEDARTVLSEMPLLSEAKVKRLILDLRDAKEIEIEGLKPSERAPKPGHTLVRLS
jgi:hypothetical protein